MDMYDKINLLSLFPEFNDIFNVEKFNNIQFSSDFNELKVQLGQHSDRLVLIVGSSGSGRDTVAREASLINHNLLLNRITTRSVRKNCGHDEIICVSKADFKILDMNKEIVASVRYDVNGEYYGVLCNELRKLSHAKGLCFLGGANDVLPIKKLLPDSYLVILLPASIETLKNQLTSRDGLNEETLLRIKNTFTELKCITGNLHQMAQSCIVDAVIKNDLDPKIVASKIIQAASSRTKVYDDYSDIVDALA